MWSSGQDPIISPKAYEKNGPTTLRATLRALSWKSPRKSGWKEQTGEKEDRLGSDR